MRWWGWLSLLLVLAHLGVTGWRITAWELLGRTHGRGTELTKTQPNWGLYLLAWMLWWSAWQ